MSRGGDIGISFKQTFSKYEMASRIMSAIRGLGITAYLQGDDSVMVAGADSITGVSTDFIGAIRDVAGNELAANRANTLTQYTIVMPEVQVDYGDAISTDTLQADNGSRHALLPIDAPQLALGVFADGDPDGQPSANAKGDDNDLTSFATTIAGVTTTSEGSGVLEFTSTPAGSDGDIVTLTDDLSNTVPFELDFDGTNSGVGVIVDISAAATADDVAAAFATAVNNAVLAGLITDLAAFESGNEVDLGGTADTVVDLSGAASVSRKLTGTFVLEFPNAGYADADTITIVDGNGDTTIFELNDLSSANIFTASNTIAIDVDLSAATPEEVVQAIADAMNTRIASGQLALGPVTVDGLTLTFVGDDEDGVTFGSIFNSDSAPVPVTVTSNGPGILDVWFDWNGDGDFRDAGEQLYSNLPIEAGETVLDVQTPVGAAIGFTTSRFRVSRLGNLHLDCIGIGGEVEDHLIEIVDGSPPVAADDTYIVLEDSSLLVAAPGVLDNDTDVNGDTILVKDEDIMAPGIQPVQDVQRGTLVLFADGSFEYTPDPDFFGLDTFVYNAVDSRLTSNAPATVTIDVKEVNDSPTAVDDEITIYEDETLRTNGVTFTANDFKGVFGNPSQFNELGQNLAIVSAAIIHPNPAFGGSITVVNNELTYVPPAQYNDQFDGPARVELTVQDDGQSWDLTAGALVDDFKTSTSTLTINITPRNDSPDYTLENKITVEEDNGPQSVQLITNVFPGPLDEDAGPANTTENQQVSFTATAVDPTLFTTLPAIDDSGVLTYELAPGVTNNPPFPPEILVEVLATDTGAGEGVIRNLFDGASLGTDTYDGATLTIVDANGDSVVFEFDDVNNAGVGTTAGVPHVPIVYDATVDTAATITTALLNAINNPPLASIATTGDGTWDGGAFEDSVTSEIRLFGESSFATDLGTATVHPLEARPANEAVVRTFTICVESINDAPVFDLPTNPIALLEDAGPQNIVDFLINAAPGPADALDELASQSLTLTVVASDPTAYATQPSAVLNADGTADLSFDLAPDINNDSMKDLSIIVTLMDDGGVNRPGDVDTTVQILNLDVTPINDAPSFNLVETEITYFEDHEQVTGNDPTVYVGFAANPVEGPGTALDETLFAATRQSLTFVTVSVSDPSLFEIQP